MAFNINTNKITQCRQQKTKKRNLTNIEYIFYLHICYVQSWVPPAHQEKAIQGDTATAQIFLLIFETENNCFYWHQNVHIMKETVLEMSKKWKFPPDSRRIKTLGSFCSDVFPLTDLKSWSLTLGKSLMSIPMLTVVRVLFGREFLKIIWCCC